MVGERPKPFGEPLGFDPMTSTLIFGEYDAVLVDAMTTVAEAEALAGWIALHNRNLETIYITHAHFDHYYGLSILLDRFPSAPAIATPKTVNAMQMPFTPPIERLARRLFPGQMTAKFVAPEPMSTTRSLSRARDCASSSRATPIVPIRRRYTFHRSAWWSQAT
jgi:glyoxylase-like metal-dependent hydrolase (beta-lactamase superfamily II)